MRETCGSIVRVEDNYRLRPITAGLQIPGSVPRSVLFWESFAIGTVKLLRYHWSLFERCQKELRFHRHNCFQKWSKVPL